MIDEFVQGGPKNRHISICLMLNWYSFVKSQHNLIIFGWEEDILNIACKLVSTILCDWHYLVVCQHNSRANFILRQHRKRTILFLQSTVETRNRCCGQYMHCFVENLFRCKSAKKYKIRLRFHKAISTISIYHQANGNVHFWGPPCILASEEQPCDIRWFSRMCIMSLLREVLALWDVAHIS